MFTAGRFGAAPLRIQQVPFPGAGTRAEEGNVMASERGSCRMWTQQRPGRHGSAGRAHARCVQRDDALRPEDVAGIAVKTPDGTAAGVELFDPAGGAE